MRESGEERKFRVWCNEQGYRCKKLQLANEWGFPDRTVFVPGGLNVFVEMKRQGEKTSKARQRKQQAWIDWLNENGFPARRCESADEAIDFIREISDP